MLELLLPDRIERHALRLVFSAWSFLASCLEHGRYKYNLYFSGTVLVCANPLRVGSVVGRQTA